MADSDSKEKIAFAISEMMGGDFINYAPAEKLLPCTGDCEAAPDEDYPEYVVHSYDEGCVRNLQTVPGRLLDLYRESLNG